MLVLIFVIGFIDHYESTLFGIVTTAKRGEISSSSSPPARTAISEITEDVKRNRGQVAFAMDRQICLRYIVVRSQGHSLIKTVRFSRSNDDIRARAPLVIITRSSLPYVERRQDFLPAQHALDGVDFVNFHSDIAFDYFGIASAPIYQCQSYLDTIISFETPFAISRQYFVRNRQERDLPNPQSRSVICQKCPQKYSPLEDCEDQVSSPDKRQDDIDHDRWRTPSFFLGVGLFLSALGLFFYSAERFAEGGKWDLCLLLLSGLCLWCGCGLVLMMLGPRLWCSETVGSA